MKRQFNFAAIAALTCLGVLTNDALAGRFGGGGGGMRGGGGGMARAGGGGGGFGGGGMARGGGGFGGGGGMARGGGGGFGGGLPSGGISRGGGNFGGGNFGSGISRSGIGGGSAIGSGGFGSGGAGNFGGGISRSGIGGGSAIGGGGFGSGGNFGAANSPFSRPAATTRDLPRASDRGNRGGIASSSVNGPFGAGNFGGGATTLPGNVSRPGQGGSGERHVWETPRGGTVVAGGDKGPFGGQGGYVYSGPHGAVSIGGGKGGSFTTQGGREISAGKGGNVVIGPNGNVHAGGGKGISVNGPNGEAIAGSRGQINAGQNGFTASGSRGGIASGAGGTIAAGSRGGIASGPGGTVAGGSRGGIATGPGGTVAGGSRGAVAVGPNGAVAGGGRFAAGSGAYGQGFAGTRYVAASDLRGQGAYVRNNFGYYNAFNSGWYTNHPGAWYAAGWIGSSIWNTCGWYDCAGYYGYAEDVAPIYYNYGDNVTYQDGYVYYGDQMTATEEDYAQQAEDIADKGSEAQTDENEKWMALGVFAMVQGDETTSNDIFQIAINKEGILRGNYYNAISDSATPVSGSLDRKSQRVAWTIGDAKEVTYETGLYNLTQDETTLLVHYDKDRTEQYKLFRVPQPEDNSQQQQPAATGAESTGQSAEGKGEAF